MPIKSGVSLDLSYRAALDRHWAASDANDFEAEHSIYRDDAVLEYPQSGERIRGRRNIQITRAKQPSKKRFAVRRVIGSGDLWVTEYVLLRHQWTIPHLFTRFDTAFGQCKFSRNRQPRAEFN
jgi:hypothetical protein